MRRSQKGGGGGRRGEEEGGGGKRGSGGNVCSAHLIAFCESQCTHSNTHRDNGTLR